MTVRTVARGAGRLAVALLVIGFITLCGLQFEHIVAKNVALAHELSTSRAQASVLRGQIDRERATIARLRLPGGAIPEIHDELQLVGPHEEIIYVHGATPSPQSNTESGH